MIIFPALSSSESFYSYGFRKSSRILDSIELKILVSPIFTLSIISLMWSLLFTKSMGFRPNFLNFK